MPVFLIFLAIYGGMHLYCFFKLSAVLPPGVFLRAVLGVLLALMLAAPILARALENWNAFLAGKIVGLVGFTWMAALFWFVVLAGLADVWNVLVRAVALAAPAARAAMLPAGGVLAVSGVLIAAACVWSYFEAADIRLRHVEIAVKDMPPELADLKIAQVTDLHLGPNVGHYRLGRTIDLLRQARPDLIVFTGDTIDSPPADVLDMARALREVQAPLGKYAIFGNHEFYTGIVQSKAFHEMAGLELLHGRSVQVAPHLVLAGVADPTARRMGVAAWADESLALPPRRADQVVILLKHRPEADKNSLGKFDLQISGHAHGGQVFPWHFITWLTFRTYAGLYDVGDGSQLYASRGTGTWGPKMRLFAPPEVTLFTFRAR